MTFSVYIPADVWITGGVSGGETQTGTFKIDLTSTHLPFNDVWTSRDSSYQFKDKLDVTATPPPPTTCQSVYTANGSGGGAFPARATPTGQTFTYANWWDNGFDEPDIAVGGQVGAHEDVQVTSSGSCPGSAEYTRTYMIQPACPRLAADVAVAGGPFDGKNDTINVDCTGNYADGVRLETHGTLHVDAYVFILPRDALKPAEWKRVLNKPHHHYPAGDLPVVTGTPFYAVTAGKVTYTGDKGTCGLGITLIGLDGVHYTYCHSSKRIAENGEVVPPGTELGLSGNTSSKPIGPHLHFEIRINKEQRCPQSLLWALYEGTQPPPDAKTVDALPAKGCTYTPE
jgi:hypothetical protein